MLTIGSIPILLKIVGKLDLKPVIHLLKGMDIFEEPKNAKSAAKSISKEKLGILACEVLAEIMPQLGKFADDVPPLVAAYKGVTVEEAKQLDAAEVLNELINDEGVTTFFARALRKKAGQKA